jgi:hypothetical protein
MKGFTRPPSVILPDNAVVPERNVIVPPPNQFTHVLTRPQPFQFASAQQAAVPDGVFPAGTKVVLLVHDDGPDCWVADGRGLYVLIAYESLETLP